MFFCMISRKIIISNSAGIHCRPASKIMQKALEFSDCKLILKSAKGDTDLSSILGLLSLGLEKGDEIVISVSGANEDKACSELSVLLALDFDFPPRF